LLRKIYGFTLITVCIFVTLFFYFNQGFKADEQQHGDDKKKISNDKKLKNNSKMIVEQSIKGVYLVDTQHNNTNWELWAESALSNSETSDWRFNDIKVKFYTKKRKIYNVNASIASVNIKKKIMVFDGGVSMTSPNGYLMKAKNLEYDFDEKKIFSNDTIEVVADKKNIKEPIHFKSKDLVVNLNSSVISLNEVTSSRKLKKNKKIKISSEEAWLFGNSYKVRYKKRVRLKGFGMNLNSYLLDLNINKKPKTLNTVVAKGRVKILSGDRTIEAGQALIEVKNEVVTLTDKPKLTQNEDILLGEKITFYAKTKVVSVKKPRAKVDKQKLESYNEPIKSN